MPAERSDILRLEVLFREGGVYVDTDFECHRPLDDVIDDYDFFTAPLKPNGWINNAFIGSTPGHPILDRALNELRPREFHGYDKHGTGPRFLDTLLQDYPEATRLPAELFYQTSPGQLERRGCHPPRGRQLEERRAATATRSSSPSSGTTSCAGGSRSWSGSSRKPASWRRL